MQLKRQSSISSTNLPLQHVGNLTALSVMTTNPLAIVIRKLIPEEAEQIFAKGQMRPLEFRTMSEVDMIATRTAAAAKKAAAATKMENSDKTSASKDFKQAADPVSGAVRDTAAPAEATQNEKKAASVAEEDAKSDTIAPTVQHPLQMWFEHSKTGLTAQVRVSYSHCATGACDADLMALFMPSYLVRFESSCQSTVRPRTHRKWEKTHIQFCVLRRGRCEPAPQHLPHFGELSAVVLGTAIHLILAQVA